MCKICDLRGKTWNGSDPVCAFDNKGMLKKNLKDNWNCATLGILRSISYDKDRVIFSDDENSSILDHEGNFIFLKWYKSRGRTDYIKIINENIDCDNLGVRTDEEICIEIAYANIKNNLLDKLYTITNDVKDVKEGFYDIIALILRNIFYIKNDNTDKIINIVNSIYTINLIYKIRLNSIYGIFGGSDE